MGDSRDLIYCNRKQISALLDLGVEGRMQDGMTGRLIRDIWKFGG